MAPKLSLSLQPPKPTRNHIFPFFISYLFFIYQSHPFSPFSHSKFSLLLLLLLLLLPLFIGVPHKFPFEFAISASFRGMTKSCCGLLKSFKAKEAHSHTQVEEIETSNVRIFSFNSLRSATADFHPSTRIGSGGFGIVYKGVLSDGSEVAIKRLSAASKQGSREFLNEIHMISRIQHPHLVQLVGCCVEDRHRILVFEFLKNNSVASVLLGTRSKCAVLDWRKRAAICKGTASGIAFLHDEAEPHIVHRDIKASNILLDHNFNPKIGDFGLAKLFPDNVTHLSTQVAGTMGYLAPEYALLGQLTKKADVYSFGVLMLEIISGSSSRGSGFGKDLLVLVEWTWRLREEGRLLEIVDPEMIDYPEEEIIRFIKVALFCTQAAANLRPTMKQVVEMLTKGVHLNDKALTEPGVLRGHLPKHLGGLESSSCTTKGKQSVILSGVESQVDSSETVTELFPR